MIFFTGMHHPSDAHRVKTAFISVHALKNRRSIKANYWIMDSGAFSTIQRYGGYPNPVEDYAAEIKRFSKCGILLAAVAQDYMCEKFMLDKTGMTISEHQKLTIERYDQLLLCDTGGVYIIPVLQGYSPEDYVSHIRQYGSRLKSNCVVGVGSVCKRNSKPEQVQAVLSAIKKERPDLLLHGFGIKYTSLPYVKDYLFSSDSMAWSFAARYEGRNSNDPQEAINYTEKVNLLL
jgi:hypothetical protein